jgi:hypothetical protein
MRAIQFELNVSKLLDIRYGESSFKRIDEFWTDFTPLGGEKTTTFIPNIIKWTEGNDALVIAMQQMYAEVKNIDDEYAVKILRLRNRFEK